MFFRQFSWSLGPDRFMQLGHFLFARYSMAMSAAIRQALNPRNNL
jgi:hypothetical protein